MKNDFCSFCKLEILSYTDGEPSFEFKEHIFCYQCLGQVFIDGYKMSGHGDGGMFWLIFKSCLESNHGRKRRRSLSANKKLLKSLLHKYKFSCVHCKTKDDLTIDHIKPVKLGGDDDFSNLQILCKSCNSKKGAKYHE